MSELNNTEEVNIISNVNFYKNVKKPSKNRGSPEIEVIDSKKMSTRKISIESPKQPDEPLDFKLNYLSQDEKGKLIIDNDEMNKNLKKNDKNELELIEKVFQGENISRAVSH